MDVIYLDNNATTPLLPAVWESMRSHLTDVFGNPGSAHRIGARARRALEDAREHTAALIGAHADEVIFTSGATEANNLALFGLVGTSGGHIISSPIEHPSVTEPIGRLEQVGFSVDRLPVNAAGIAKIDLLPGLLRPDTGLVSIMLANHETGSLQPVPTIAAQLEKTMAFHCDAVQAVGKIPVHFHNLGVTTLSLSAHKFHGPKGIGALVVRRHTRLQPLMLGGHQQQGKRPGTEPVALAVGLATALDLAHRQAAERTEKIHQLRSCFLGLLQENASPVVRNGPTEVGCSIPHTLNLSFPGCRADALLMNLDLAGVACSTGSACSSGSLLPSPVLQAMGVPDEVLKSAMRFSFSALLTQEEVTDGARRVAAVVNRLRRTSVS
jgi:cysteine desulfurase